MVGEHAGIVDPAEGSFDAAIGVPEGRITALGRDLGPGSEEIDATGRLVKPGGVDPDCHVEQFSGMR